MDHDAVETISVSDRSAIVTGAARGIGAALATELLARGARVLITDVDADALEHTGAELAGRYGDDRVAWQAGDASSETTIAEWIALAQERHGPVDLYVANAGIGGGAGLDSTDEQWAAALDINVMAHVRAARLLVPGWAERGEGIFLTTASAAGLLTQIGSAVYAVTKHGAVAFAEWLAVTYGASGVRVSCLCPMGVDTALLRSGAEEGDIGRTAQAAVTSAGEVLSPEHVARITVDAVERGDLLILPHPEVAEFVRRKATDHPRWVGGMQRFQHMLSTPQEDRS
ncbi:MAG: SDR family oxidoreductase [Mobilicoccus sp.]|nr:SDR family oxidoreductase [Mobilicoccus sp.]